LEPVNLLILDEPTNHLDIASKEVLKQAICAFDGTVIVVSHDRDFLDGTVSKVYEFAHGRVREHLGGIYQFLAEAEAEQAARLAPAQRAETPKPASAATTASKTAKPTTTPAATAPTATTPTQPTALSFEAQKELKRQRQKVERDVHNAEVEIARLEAEIARTESEMMTPEGSSNPDLFKRHAALKQQLDAQTDAWMLASEQLENL
jgi:ATP-binding cassette subfamily F protein 3